MNSSKEYVDKLNILAKNLEIEKEEISDRNGSINDTPKRIIHIEKSDEAETISRV